MGGSMACRRVIQKISKPKVASTRPAHAARPFLAPSFLFCIRCWCISKCCQLQFDLSQFGVGCCNCVNSYLLVVQRSCEESWNSSGFFFCFKSGGCSNHGNDEQ